ncbi:hypothetical protein AB1L08_16220 [Siminovitchia sp. 179-K 8D1 HS]
MSKVVRILRNSGFCSAKTNIPFLINVMEHEQFTTGEYDTSFLDSSTKLYSLQESRDRGAKMLNYIGTVTVNGFPCIEKTRRPIREPHPFRWTTNPVRD